MLGASPFGVPVISPDQSELGAAGGEARARRDDPGGHGSVQRQDLVFLRLRPRTAPPIP